MTRFLYAGDELVAEYDGSGTMIRRYAHGAGVDDPLVWYEGSGVAAPTFLTADWQGSITAQTDAGGNANTINRYNEWGIPRTTNRGRFGYTGQAWIPELRMWHYKARIYSPTMGRFLQTDPVGYDDQVNLYAYVGNDPVNRSDPDGQQMLANPFDNEYVADFKRRFNEAAARGLWEGEKNAFWKVASAVSFLIAPEAAEVSAIRSGIAVAKSEAPLVVLGNYPAYTNLAEKIGARVFTIPAKIWEKMNPAQQWAANKLFLDRQIARGATFRLATPVDKARTGSAYVKELEYLKSKGYEFSRDGLSMARTIRP